MMFPSSKNDNPFNFFLKRSSFLCDQQNPSSKQDEPVPFFLNFPSPFFDENEMPLNQILSQSCQIMAANHHYHEVDQIENHSTVTKPNIAASMSNGKDADQGINPNGIDLTPPRRRNTSGVPRKRTGKKDRHSKICTAQGIRDRRMRLSLQVARKFFDLQDMLGFDKASKTIEWLFTKSKKAIKDLEKDHPHISTSEARSHESFLSECEVMSGIEETSNNDVIEGMMNIAPAKIITGPSCLDPSEKTDKRWKKTESDSTMRESRDKARARARSRTREKMMIKWCNKSNPNHDIEDTLKLESLTSSCPFEGVDQESRSHDQENKVSPFMSDFNSIGNQLPSDEGTIEKLLGNSRTPSYCPISDYSHFSDSVAGCLDSNAHFMGFLGNWDLFHSDKITSSPSEYSATNQLPFAGNPISVYSATPPNFQVFNQ